MRFWFVHSGEVALRAQIVTQIKLGILSGELGPGERLPSIRDLARRFHIHPNTVSAAYRQLEHECWVALRRGSGVYVPDRARPDREVGENGVRLCSLDDSIATLIQAAGSLGVAPLELRKRFLSALDAKAAKKFLLIEPDPELRDIVLWELRAALNVQIGACKLPLADIESELKTLGREVVPLVLPSKAEAVRVALKKNRALYVLQIRPIAGSLAKHLPASREGLIGIASRWPQFVEFGRTMLVAAGFPADSIVVRDAKEKNWDAGLNQTDAIVCDSLTAGLLTFHKKIIPFSLIAEESLAELRSMLIGSFPAPR